MRYRDTKGREVEAMRLADFETDETMQLPVWVIRAVACGLDIAEKDWIVRYKGCYAAFTNEVFELRFTEVAEGADHGDDEGEVGGA